MRYLNYTRALAVSVATSRAKQVLDERDRKLMDDRASTVHSPSTAALSGMDHPQTSSSAPHSEEKANTEPSGQEQEQLSPQQKRKRSLYAELGMNKDPSLSPSLKHFLPWLAWRQKQDVMDGRTLAGKFRLQEGLATEQGEGPETTRVHLPPTSPTLEQLDTLMGLFDPTQLAIGSLAATLVMALLQTYRHSRRNVEQRRRKRESFTAGGASATANGSAAEAPIGVPHEQDCTKLISPPAILGSKLLLHCLAIVIERYAPELITVAAITAPFPDEMDGRSVQSSYDLGSESEDEPIAIQSISRHGSAAVRCVADVLGEYEIPELLAADDSSNSSSATTTFKLRYSVVSIFLFLYEIIEEFFLTSIELMPSTDGMVISYLNATGQSVESFSVNTTMGAVLSSPIPSHHHFGTGSSPRLFGTSPAPSPPPTQLPGKRPQ